ncbi:hypothetical protein AB4037_17805 [Labrys sp. KB_33_2]|uniref:hypothetical protein n=1 Tax=Labrys sp. KB_33_2 TaxID=3237479 RepID=UPI003F908148
MKTVLRIALFAIFLASPARAATYEPVDGSRIVVLDGDTVALPCKKPGRGCAERVRLRDIDAPEVSTPIAQRACSRALRPRPGWYS